MINKYDYDGNYPELIQKEMHRLYELESKVPYCWKGEIHSMAITMQSMLQQIQRNREFDDWNY